MKWRILQGVVVLVIVALFITGLDAIIPSLNWLQAAAVIGIILSAVCSGLVIVSGAVALFEWLGEKARESKREKSRVVYMAEWNYAREKWGDKK